VITGAGAVLISGPAAAYYQGEVFVANNTYTGPTTINAGSALRVGWAT